MNKATSWPVVPLGEEIRHRKEFITIDDFTEYNRCRVQLHAKGIVLRDTVFGSSIRTKKQQVCRAGEFLVAEIDAKVGGFGIVPDGLESAIVSSHYFLFEIEESRLDRRFLDYYTRTRAFRDQVEAQGSTNYAAIRPQHVLEYTAPLPPLAEQQRIVARIDALAAHIEEAKGLRAQAVAEVEAVMGAARASVFEQLSQAGTQRLDSVAVLQRGKFSHRPRNEPRFFGGQHPWIQIQEIESSGKHITQWSETLNDDGLAISRKFPCGTVLISIAATIGAVGILGFDCCVPDSIVAVTPGPHTTSEFLYHYLGFVRTHLESVAPQSAQKNINLKILSPLPIPVPNIDKQHSTVNHLDELQAHVDAVKRIQAETQAELDALLPSVLDRAFRGEL